MSDRKKLYLFMPSYSGEVDYPAVSMASRAANADKIDITMDSQGRSLLAHNFNQAYCDALNRRVTDGFTHFVMQHADVTPLRANWAGMMIKEMERTGAKVISAAIAIKDESGDTSTAFYPREDGNEIESFTNDKIKRLSIRELQDVPTTFTAADCGRPESILLINTGLMVIDIREEWAEQLYFEIASWIVKGDKFGYRAQVLPEDWNLSLQLDKRGIPYACTKIVPCLHRGTKYFGTELKGNRDGESQREHAASEPVAVGA